jgi:hypothetical protein
MNCIATEHWTLDDVDVALFLGCGKEPSSKVDFLDIQEQLDVCASEHRRRGSPLTGKTLQDIRAYKQQLFGGAGFPKATLHDAANGRQCATKPETSQVTRARATSQSFPASLAVQVPQRRRHVCMAACVVIRNVGVTLGQRVQPQLRLGR